ncbi:hypothetical protein ACFLIM_40285 [Nonomuraea sp. M3C6]|uniref:Integrase core domain-containing protein n=1 Tax=Nonomuraea marmarensis TaxID=3351344 RepID=A0ABW7AT96_9ACTN
MGYVYVGFVDVYSRAIVGCTVSLTNHTTLVRESLDMACGGANAQGSRSSWVHPSLRHPLISDQADGGKRSQIPHHVNGVRDSRALRVLTAPRSPGERGDAGRQLR